MFLYIAEVDNCLVFKHILTTSQTAYYTFNSLYTVVVYPSAGFKELLVIAWPSKIYLLRLCH